MKVAQLDPGQPRRCREICKQRRYANIAAEISVVDRANFDNFPGYCSNETLIELIIGDIIFTVRIRKLFYNYRKFLLKSLFIISLLKIALLRITAAYPLISGILWQNLFFFCELLRRIAAFNKSTKIHYLLHCGVCTKIEMIVFSEPRLFYLTGGSQLINIVAFANMGFSFDCLLSRLPSQSAVFQWACHPLEISLKRSTKNEECKRL